MSERVAGVAVVLLVLFALSTIARWRIAFAYGILGVELGNFEFTLNSETWSRDWGIDIGAEFHWPQISTEWHFFQNTGVLGASGWKTRYWLLRFPILLIAFPFIFFAVIAGTPRMRPGAIDRFDGLIRLLFALPFGTTTGLFGAIATSQAIIALYGEHLGFYPALMLFVFLPMFLGCGLGWLAYSVLSTRGVQRLDHRCTACGYDLTGNVSGRCPECGRDTESPR